MPTKSDLIDNLNWTTERLSSRVWSIAVGVLATCLAYIIESTKKNGEPFLSPVDVAMPAGIALIALLLDLLQYVAANRQSLALLREIEAKGAESGLYDPKSFASRLRSFAYTAKIGACVVSAVWLIVISTWRVLALI